MLNSTVTELSAALASRKVSSVELTRLFLDRTRRLNGRLNAFITVDEERSLAQAAGPAIASMLIYLLMAIVLAWKPQGLFPAHKGSV